MAGHTFRIVVDAVDPPRAAAFWRTALGYVAEPPPAGYAGWDEYATANGIPPERRADAAVDPDGVGPGCSSLGFRRRGR